MATFINHADFNDSDELTDAIIERVFNGWRPANIFHRTGGMRVRGVHVVHDGHVYEEVEVFFDEYWSPHLFNAREEMGSLNPQYMRVKMHPSRAKLIQEHIGVKGRVEEYVNTWTKGRIIRIFGEKVTVEVFQTHYQYLQAYGFVR